MVEYARVAQGRYLTYAAKGLDVMKDTDLEHEFAKAVAGHAVIGTPDEVVAQLTDYVTALPVDPLLLRPQWPTMTADETIATLDRLGRDVVPAITAITPRHDIDEALLDPTPRGPRRDSRTTRLHRPRPGLSRPGDVDARTTCCATTRRSGPTRCAWSFPRRT